MGDLFRVFLTTALLVPATLLPIINPLVGAPIFMTMTGDHRQLAVRMARRVGLNCFFLLTGSYFIGGYVLEFFGVSIPAVRVAGGILVGSTAWRLLSDSGQDELQKSLANAAEEMLDREIARRSFLPMTFPLTVGPGTIAAAITLGTARPEHGVALVASVTGAVVGLATAALTVYLTYRYSRPLLSRLGDTGILVLTRLAAFLLLAIGIDILWSGLAEFIRAT